MSSPALLSPTDVVCVGEKVSDAWCYQTFQQHFDWLHELDCDSTPLQRWLEQSPSPLLGFYFEQLLAFWLQHLPDVGVLARNLTVGAPGRRVGEFDLLLEYLQGYFAERYQALLLAELHRVSGVWREASRGFVVNQHWPE